MKPFIHLIQGITGRIAVLILNIRNQMMTILQVYAPTVASPEEEIEEFYETVETTLNKFKTETNIVMGDFNSGNT